jgi:Class II Aldolase and Adducin N-terminal domain
LLTGDDWLGLTGNPIAGGSSLAPILVTANDIMEYDLDSNPVDPKERRSVLERFIHGEIYKARPDVRYAVYTEVNARLQAIALGLGGPINYISAEEAATRANAPNDFARAWALWKKKALGK